MMLWQKEGLGFLLRISRSPCSSPAPLFFPSLRDNSALVCRACVLLVLRRGGLRFGGGLRLGRKKKKFRRWAHFSHRYVQGPGVKAR